MIQSRAAPPARETQAQGGWIGPPSIEPQTRRVACSQSAGPAGCAFSKHKAAGECPNPTAAEPAACAPASQAGAARLVCRPAARSGHKITSQTQSGWIPLLRARIPSQSGWSRGLRVPRTKLLDWLINGLIDCQGPHLQNSEELSLIHISEPTRQYATSRMPSSA